ncbi:MAG: hypothetical protein KKE39_04955 [Bacteroidetes bacterium]|nr:hypothetical protein [Bacteroidota bacterium]
MSYLDDLAEKEEKRLANLYQEPKKISEAEKESERRISKMRANTAGGLAIFSLAFGGFIAWAGYNLNEPILRPIGIGAAGTGLATATFTILLDKIKLEKHNYTVLEDFQDY